MSTDTDTINHHRLIISIINIYLLRYRCSVDLSMMGDLNTGRLINFQNQNLDNVMSNAE